MEIFESNLGAAFTHMIRMMPEHECIRILSTRSRTQLIVGALAEHLEPLKSPEKFNVVVMPARVGSGDFMTDLEYTHFNVHTSPEEIAEQFEARVLKWADLVWWIVTIPAQKKILAYQTAEKYQMRIDEDMLPMVISGQGAATFPLRENVSSLIYQSGHPAYDNDQKELDNLHKQERDRTRRTFAKYGDDDLNMPPKSGK